MVTAQVVLREEVFKVIHARKAWPHDAAFKEWVRDVKGNTLSSDVMPKLRAQGVAPLETIELMIEYHLSSKIKQQNQKQRARAFGLILADLGFAEPDTFDVATIARIMTKAEVDYLAIGADSIIAATKSGIARSPALSAQATEAEINALVLWMYVNLGRRVPGSATNLPIDQAKKIAEEVIGIPLEEYQQRASSWKAKHAWTIAPVRINRILVGAPIILPLKESAYQQIRSGHLFASEVTPEDLEVPTHTIFVEGISEARNEFAGHSGNVTLHLRAAIARQLGYFCASPDSRGCGRVRLLSRKASSLAATRLEGCDFRPIGTFEHKSGLPLVEHEIDPLGKSNDHFLVSAVIVALGALPDSSDQLAQRSSE